MIDFNIIVNAAKAGVSRAGFGRIALLSTEIDQDYTLVKNLNDLEIDKDTETYKVLQAMFMQKPSPREVVLIGNTAGGYEDVLEELLDITDDFFFITVVGEGDIETIAQEVELLEKVLMVTIRDVSQAETLAEKLYENTFYVYQKEDYPAEALAVVMSYNVGGKTAHFQQLNGVSPGKLSNEDIDRVLKANGNVYITKKGQNQISGGRVASGQWLDVVLGAYWVKFTLEERVMMLALNEDKIPYTNRGIGMLAGVVSTVMSEAVDREILEDFIVEYRNAEDVAPEEKATRVYNYLTVSGQLAGAIHGGDITINLVYELGVEA